MALINKNPNLKQTIDTTGPAGNSHYLIGLAIVTAKDNEWNPEQLIKLIDAMTYGTYNNLLEVFSANFSNQFDVLI